jgi:hypothetical protein
MKFINKEKILKELMVNTIIESDGCCVICVQGIGILRLVNDGTIAIIQHDPVKSKILQELGFKMFGTGVSLN